MEKEKIYLAVKTRYISMRVDVDEILYLERHCRKILLVTENEEIEYYERLCFVTPLLDESFFSVLQGLYVNLEKVEYVRDHRCIFDCGKEVSLSDRAYAKLKVKHNAFYRMMQLEKLGVRGRET